MKFWLILVNQQIFINVAKLSYLILSIITTYIFSFIIIITLNALLKMDKMCTTGKTQYKVWYILIKDINCLFDQNIFAG